MKSIKPKTYNELMLYNRCADLRRNVPGLDNELMVKIYHFLNESDENKIWVHQEKIAFYHNEEVVDSVAVAVSESVAYITLARTFILQKMVSTSDSGDAGSSGNNNNNNTNNNTG